MSGKSTERNLLVSVLALQLDFATPPQLINAIREWALQKSTSIEAILVQQQAIDEGMQQLLKTLAEKHIEVHDADPCISLSSLTNRVPTISEFVDSIAGDQMDETVQLMPAGQPRTSDADNVGNPARTETLGNRFRILRKHAEGGLGVVSIAHDYELKRQVALKQMKHKLANDPDCRSRFVFEAKLNGSLEHPSVVPVYGLGEEANGNPFYAMQFVDGPTLESAIKDYHSGDYPHSSKGTRLIQLLKNFTDVCNAVRAAHEQGIVHRDIKPNNIILGRFGEAFLLDWGLAERMTGSIVECKSIAGTPSYMSPEQAAGDPVDHRSDIYSLGATLYELLTGSPPFESRGPNALIGIEELLAKVRSGDFPRPSRRRIVVDRQLEEICLRAMALSPTERFQDANEIVDSIEEYLSDLPLRSWRRDVQHFREMREENPDEIEFHISLGKSHQSLGIACWGQQRFDDALTNLETAKALLSPLKAVEPQVMRDLAGICLTLSRVHAQLRKKDEALNELEQAQDTLADYLEHRGREANPELLMQIFGHSPIGFFRYLFEQ